MLYNPNDIMPDKMGDNDQLKRVKPIKYIIIAVIIILSLIGVGRYLMNSENMHDDSYYIEER